MSMIILSMLCAAAAACSAAAPRQNGSIQSSALASDTRDQLARSLREMLPFIAPVPAPQHSAPLDPLGRRYLATTWPPTREYWMIYRGPGFLAVVWFGSSSLLPPFPAFCLQVVSLSQPFWVSPVSSLLTGGGGRGWSRSEITRRRESLVFYKAFITIWLPLSWLVISINVKYVLQPASIPLSDLFWVFTNQ